jgi:AhpD family alkylhydroperoxidase
MQALQALGTSARKSGLPDRTLDLVNLRASQINGCSVCVEMHAQDLKKGGETDERLFAVAAWREAVYFTDAERAALALTEAATRIADRPDPVPDDIWEDAARHYDEPALAGLDPGHRQHQRLEPAQRGHPADGRRGTSSPVAATRGGLLHRQERLMKQGIGLLVYPVKDLGRAKALFSALLGTEPYADAPYYVGYRVGEQEIGLDPNGHKSGATGPIGYCEVADIRKSLQALLAAGAETQQDVKDVGGGRQIATVRDASGNVLGLMQSA